VVSTQSTTRYGQEFFFFFFFFLVAEFIIKHALTRAQAGNAITIL
jgi:hypothetical protein